MFFREISILGELYFPIIENSQLIYYIMYNDRSNFYSPYPLKTNNSASSLPYVPSAIRPPAEPQPSNARTKSYLLQKVQALLPYLAEILKQNDDRTSGVVNKLSGLRDNIDGIFADL